MLVEMSCIVLAGGKSARLGRNKITENIGGKMLLERVLDTLSLFNCEIIIVTSTQSYLPELDKYPKVKLVRDIYPNRGSLGGIYSGLFFSKSFYNLLVAGDMPFLSINLLQYMLDIAQGYDLTAFREGDKFEPLHAVYSKNCIVPLKMLLERENVRIMEILRYVNTRYLTLKEIGRFDHGHLSFFNVNYEADLQKALEIANTELPQPPLTKILR
jgi:molybdopterin-guanine dinucleotide biosynthesis protein A